MQLIGKFCINIFIAPWTMAKVSARLNNSTKTFVHAIPFVTCFGLFICLHLAELACQGCWALAWFFYLCYAAMNSYVRIQMREELDIEGSPFEDLILCIVFYPNVAVQMEESLNDLGKFCLLGEFLLIRNCRKNFFALQFQTRFLNCTE